MSSYSSAKGEQLLAANSPSVTSDHDAVMQSRITDTVLSPLLVLYMHTTIYRSHQSFLEREAQQAARIARCSNQWPFIGVLQQCCAS